MYLKISRRTKPHEFKKQRRQKMSSKCVSLVIFSEVRARSLRSLTRRTEKPGGNERDALLRVPLFLLVF